MVLGCIKSPFTSNPCVFQSIPNKEDQRRVKLFLMGQTCAIIEIGWPDCQMAMPLGMVARWQIKIIRLSCEYMRTSNLDMVLFTIK